MGQHRILHFLKWRIRCREGHMLGINTVGITNGANTQRWGYALVAGAVGVAAAERVRPAQGHDLLVFMVEG